MPVHRSLRAAAIGATALAALLIPAAGAQAHVRVIPDSTASGGFAKLTFRVPNESPTAGTTALTITLPSDAPLAFVSAQPLPGWTVSVTKAKLPKPVTDDGTTITEAAHTVTWKAQAGNQIAPGEFQEFSISAGPLPDPGMLSIPAAQAYSDGKVVEWNQPQPEGAAEPENPVPSFEVTAATGDDDHAAAATTVASTDSDDGAGAWPWVSGASLVVAIAALAVAVLGRRKPGTQP